MRRPRMINRMWGLKQDTLHAFFVSLAWTPPNCEERTASKNPQHKRIYLIFDLDL